MILKTIKSFRCAIRGFGKVMRYENNAKIHLIATLVVLIFGFYFRISFRDWCLLLIAVTLVWVSETLNTAIEKLVDLLSPDYNEKAGNIKDIAAGAVLIASIGALIIGIIVFDHYLFHNFAK
ncbi:MAG TPA: diacylglycerol kinase family protein [Cytophagaceae bacterium]|jgi:diacylglycerol kinase|nr:diacylglycerol kinase family protein [Cytophagaceae bacterium]